MKILWIEYHRIYSVLRRDNSFRREVKTDSVQQCSSRYSCWKIVLDLIQRAVVYSVTLCLCWGYSLCEARLKAARARYSSSVRELCGSNLSSLRQQCLGWYTVDASFSQHTSTTSSPRLANMSVADILCSITSPLLSPSTMYYMLTARMHL